MFKVISNDSRAKLLKGKKYLLNFSNKGTRNSLHGRYCSVFLTKFQQLRYIPMGYWHHSGISYNFFINCSSVCITVLLTLQIFYFTAYFLSDGNNYFCANKLVS